jgi:hypothetical protein
LLVHMHRNFFFECEGAVCPCVFVPSVKPHF